MVLLLSVCVSVLGCGCGWIAGRTAHKKVGPCLAGIERQVPTPTSLGCSPHAVHRRVPPCQNFTTGDWRLGEVPDVQWNTCTQLPLVPPRYLSSMLVTIPWSPTRATRSCYEHTRVHVCTCMDGRRLPIRIPSLQYLNPPDLPLNSPSGSISVCSAFSLL